MTVPGYEFLANQYREPHEAILNLGDQEGTHWVGCLTKRDGIIDYYDPFGVNSPFLHLDRVVRYNNIKDQNLNQSNCGWRVLFFILNARN